MKVLTCLLVLCSVCVLSARSAEKPTVVTWEGKNIQNISEVRLNPDGRVVVIHGSSGFSTTQDKLPAEFLQAWGITPEKLEAAKAAKARSSEVELARAAQAGQFREVNGIVYDLRKPQPDWNLFSNVQMVQVTDEGALINVSRDPQAPIAILVRNLPRMLADYEKVTFTAKLTGTFSYVNRAGFERTIRAYDAGRACKLDELPEAITNEGKSWAAAEGKTPASGLAKLPDSSNLRSVGTGFFITEDGYFVSNWHVIRELRSIKVRTGQKLAAAQVVKMDRGRDLALLKVEGGPYGALPISVQASAALGDPVFTIGFPNVHVQGMEPKYTDGKISSMSGVQDDPDQYQISVPVQPGNSGGPLMDRNGCVVGVVDARLNDLRFLANSGSLPQNVNYAIKSRVLREFLANTPQVKLPESRKSAPNSEEAVKTTEAAVGMVLVY